MGEAGVGTRSWRHPSLGVLKILELGTSLVVQELRLHPSNAEDPGSIPSQGARSHGLQLRVHMPQLKILLVQ